MARTAGQLWQAGLRHRDGAPHALRPSRSAFSLTILAGSGRREAFTASGGTIGAPAFVITLAALSLQLQAPDAWCWRTTLDGFDPYGLALDGRGDVVLSGTFGNITSPLGFGVVDATGSGALNWRHVVTKRGNASAELPRARQGISTRRRRPARRAGCYGSSR